MVVSRYRGTSTVCTSGLIISAGHEIALLHPWVFEALGDCSVGMKGFRFDLPTFPSVIELLQCIQVTKTILESGVALSLLQSTRFKPSSVLVFGRIYNEGSTAYIYLTNIRRS